MEIRVKYLENVVNKILSSPVAKNKRNTTTADPATPINMEQPGSTASDIRLVMPKYKVPYRGNIVIVTADVLEKDQELLQYMVQHHPGCFMQ